MKLLILSSILHIIFVTEGVSQPINEKVIQWVSLGPHYKKVTSECFATPSASVTMGTRQLVPIYFYRRIQNHHFYGLIDFGVMGTGDPACDYAMAWTYFDKQSRKIFLDGLKEDMIDRAKGWALWKALITYCWKRRKTKITSCAVLCNSFGTAQEYLLFLYIFLCSG